MGWLLVTNMHILSGLSVLFPKLTLSTNLCLCIYILVCQLPLPTKLCTFEQNWFIKFLLLVDVGLFIGRF